MNDPSAPTAPESPPQPTEKQEPSLSQTLLRTNQELRAAIVSNVIKKGLIGLGVGIGLGLFIFKSKSSPAIMRLSLIPLYDRKICAHNVQHRYRPWHGIFGGLSNGPRLS